MKSKERQETVNSSFRKQLIEECGKICVNCGSSEYIEYHHIVPLFLGGSNNFSNIVPLCNRCHKAAHKGRHMSLYVNKKNSGRSALNTDEYAYSVFDKYIMCEIGTRECKELLGYANKTPLRERTQFVKYRKEKGIKDYRNNVDIIRAKRGSSLNCISGYVLYEDGTRKYFKHTPLIDEEELKSNISSEIDRMAEAAKEAFVFVDCSNRPEKWDPFAEVDRFSYSI